MIAFLLGNEALGTLCMLNALLALSQFVVLRAGVFSLATPGLAAMGAYTAGGLTLRFGLPPAVTVVCAGLVALAGAMLLALPLARLRGVFQAIATLAFVQILISLALYAEPLTGGATGLNGIPQSVGIWHVAVTLGLITYVVARLGASPTGRAFDTIRQDETVAVSLGIDVVRHHALAFALSGLVGGIAGGLMASHNYSVNSGEFGFGMMIAVLSFVVLGGRQSVAGPITGAFVLTLLPELARPLAENRMIVYGTLLMVAIIYLPHGIVDTWLLHRLRRQSTGAPGTAGSAPKQAGI
jgi:branched-chain amino acid transport system permease protein